MQLVGHGADGALRARKVGRHRGRRAVQVVAHAGKLRSARRKRLSCLRHRARQALKARLQVVLVVVFQLVGVRLRLVELRLDIGAGRGFRVVAGSHLVRCRGQAVAQLPKRGYGRVQLRNHGIHRGAVLLVELRLDGFEHLDELLIALYLGIHVGRLVAKALRGVRLIGIHLRIYLVNGIGHLVEAVGTLCQGVGQRRNRRRQRIADGFGAAFRPRGLLLRVLHRVLRVAQKLGGASHERLRRPRQVRVRLEHIGSGAHLIGGRGYGARKLGHPPRRIGIVGHRPQRVDQPQGHIGDGLGERGVHLGGNLAGRLVGHARRHGVLLLVLVVDKLGMLGVVGVEAHHVGAEALRDDHGRIVLARTRPVDGVLLVGEHPIKLVVGAQRRLHAVSHVDLRGQQVALVSLVGIGDGHLQITRVVEHVPARDDVVPRENRRQEHQAQDDDHGYHVAEQVLDIVGEQLEHVTHGRPPSLNRPSS